MYQPLFTLQLYDIIALQTSNKNVGGRKNREIFKSIHAKEVVSVLNDWSQKYNMYVKEIAKCTRAWEMRRHILLTMCTILGLDRCLA